MSAHSPERESFGTRAFIPVRTVWATFSSRIPRDGVLRTLTLTWAQVRFSSSAPAKPGVGAAAAARKTATTARKMRRLIRTPRIAERCLQSVSHEAEGFIARPEPCPTDCQLFAGQWLYLDGRSDFTKKIVSGECLDRNEGIAKGCASEALGCHTKRTGKTGQES